MSEEHRFQIARIGYVYIHGPPNSRGNSSPIRTQKNFLTWHSYPEYPGNESTAISPQRLGVIFLVTKQNGEDQSGEQAIILVTVLDVATNNDGVG